jgi:thiosulfate reductase cytochrome b subunit
LSVVVCWAYGLASGRFKRRFLPVMPASVPRDLGNALRGRLAHDMGTYNAVQHMAYLGVIVVVLLIMLSGLAIWKPVQFSEIAWVAGGYEGARLVHFFCMCALVVFVVVHVAMVLVVPRTFLPMLLSSARVRSHIGPHDGPAEP